MEKNFIATNVPGLYRDINSGVILNRNMSEYDRYKSEIEQQRKNSELITKVDSLSRDIEDIKLMLNSLKKVAA